MILLSFMGQRMRSELDMHLYNDPKNELLNPDYSIVNDTITYFLTWTDKPGNKRLKSIANDISNPAIPYQRLRLKPLYHFRMHV